MSTPQEAAATATEAGQQFAGFWGGQGPLYEELAAGAEACEPGSPEPWWDGERLHHGDAAEPELPDLEAGS